MVLLGCNWADHQQWGLTGRITLYMGIDCLNPTSNNSPVHAVSRGYTSDKAKWQFT